MVLFSSSSNSDSAPKTPPTTPPTTPKRRSRALFRSQSGSESGSPSASPAKASPTSAPGSASAPSSPLKRPPIGIAGVANIFVRMRRASDQAARKPWHIQSSSGDQPLSHPGVLEGAEVSGLKEPLPQRRETFICHDAVNVVQLLRATRNALMEDAEFMGANALVDEQWDCTICGPKHRRNGSFKVEISYSATATRSARADPHRPVALDKVKNVPGLMTISKRLA